MEQIKRYSIYGWHSVDEEDEKGDYVHYEDFERILVEMQKKHMEEVKEYEDNLSYYRDLVG